jgi:hypothetical protein
MQLTVCTGRRCWRNGAGLLLAAAQLSAPPELAVVSTACCGFCPPGKVLVCEEASCPGPSMILAIESEEAATKAAAEAIATILAQGRSDDFSSHDCSDSDDCAATKAVTDATATVIAERRTTPPQMKIPPSPFEERMNQQRAAQRERDAAPADRPEAAEEAAGAADAAEAESIAWAEDILAKEADRMLSEGYEGAGEPRASLPPADVVPLLMRALQFNSCPEADSGLHSMWAFATGTTRFIFANNRSEFVESAHETADSLPTSFYGVALHGKSWKLEGELNRVCGDSGWIATQVMRAYLTLRLSPSLFLTLSLTPTQTQTSTPTPTPTPTPTRHAGDAHSELRWPSTAVAVRAASAAAAARSGCVVRGEHWLVR